MVAPEILGNQKMFLMLSRLILKGTKFQLPTPNRFSTAVIFFGGWGEHACQIGLHHGQKFNLHPNSKMKGV